MKRLLVSSACALLCSAPFTAWADPPIHDGFQFRGAIGGGYLSDSESPESAKLSGGSFGFDLYVGGHVIPGVAIGGMLGGQSAASPSVSIDGRSYSGSDGSSLTVVWLGPYVDWHIDPRGGFHVMAMPELTRLAVSTGNGASGETGVGWGVGVGVGYDFWLGHAFNMGILGRLNYSSNSFSGGGTNYTDNVITPSLMLTFNYN